MIDTALVATTRTLAQQAITDAEAVRLALLSLDATPTKGLVIADEATAVGNVDRARTIKRGLDKLVAERKRLCQPAEAMKAAVNEALAPLERQLAAALADLKAADLQWAKTVQQQREEAARVATQQAEEAAAIADPDAPTPDGIAVAVSRDVVRGGSAISYRRKTPKAEVVDTPSAMKYAATNRTRWFSFVASEALATYRAWRDAGLLLAMPQTQHPSGGVVIAGVRFYEEESSVIKGT